MVWMKKIIECKRDNLVFDSDTGEYKKERCGQKWVVNL